MKLFIVCSIWLLLLSSFVQANVVWDKEINEFKTSYSLEHTDNLYSQKSDKVSDTKGVFKINYKLLKLFEGYGLSIPLSVSQQNYQHSSQLNGFSYSIKPNLHVFVSDQTSIDFILNKSKKESLSGQDGAEFVDIDDVLVTLENESAQINLNLGRDKKYQFLDVSLSLNNSHQNSESKTISENEVKTLKSTYGHRISEDTYLLVDGKLNQGKRFDIETKLHELGFGFLTRIGGSHHLNVIAGFYKREGDEQSDGYFWRASDKWTLSERNLINIHTSQASLISFAEDTLTQLNTELGVNWAYRLSKTHLLNLMMKKRKQDFEQTFRKYNKDSIKLSWNWFLLEGMTLKSYIEFSQITDRQSELDINDIKFNQTKLNVELAYIW